MSVVAGRPESGLRIELERPRGGGPPWAYEGLAVTPGGEWAVSATVSETGEVSVNAEAAAPKDLSTKVLLLLRAAFKHAKADGVPPPRRIVRWRGDK